MPPITFALSQEQYEALIFLARKGATTEYEKTQLEAFLKDIEKTNNITRYFLLVQWQEADAPLPPGSNFPTSWPPEFRWPIELVTRPIARADVDAVLQARAKKPVNVLVTTDPNGIVGWTEVDDYFL